MQTDVLQEKIYTSFQDLIGLQFVKKPFLSLSNLVSKSKRIGQHHSTFRGQGVDFLESRIYESGDDVRRIDWQVTARTGKLHTKVFAEDHEIPIFIVVDQSMSMYFGSQFCFKSVQAARLAAMLSWQSVAMSNRVGGLVYGENDYQLFAPSLRRKRLLRWLGVINQFNHLLSVDDFSSAHSSFLNVNQALNEALGLMRFGHYQVYLISDGFGYDQKSFDLLRKLAFYHSVRFFRIYDPLEAGQVKAKSAQVIATDGYEDHCFRFNAHKISKMRRSFDQHEQDLIQKLNERHIHYQSISTDKSLEEFF